MSCPFDVAMKPYDVAITKLRELGVDPEADADKLANPTFADFERFGFISAPSGRICWGFCMSAGLGDVWEDLARRQLAHRGVRLRACI